MLKKPYKPKVAKTKVALSTFQEKVAMRPINERLVNNNLRPGLAPVAEQSPPATPTETDPAAIKGTSGKLKAPAAYKLYKEMEKHLSTFEAEGMSSDRVAEYMTKVMGFEVTPSHIETGKRATGLKWKCRPKKRRDVGKPHTNKSSLVLSNAILELYRRCGEVPSQEFTDWLKESHYPGWSHTHNTFTNTAAPE
jgi:hypothetical protein